MIEPEDLTPWVCGVFVSFIVLCVVLAVYFSYQPTRPNATVITPSETFEDCHVRSFYRYGGISLDTKDGRRIYIQGSATIVWKGAQEVPCDR